MNMQKSQVACYNYRRQWWCIPPHPLPLYLPLDRLDYALSVIPIFFRFWYPLFHLCKYGNPKEHPALYLSAWPSELAKSPAFLLHVHT